MTELRGFDFDGLTSRAWRAFAGRLADHLADMEEGDTLEIGLVGLPTEAPGSGPSSVNFTGCEGALVRAVVTVSPPPASDAVDRRAGESSYGDPPALAELLAELGWQRFVPAATGSDHAVAGSFQAEQIVPRREGDHLSSQTVRLLCEVLGAVHPVFLKVSGDHDLVERSPDGYPIADVVDLGLPAVTEPIDAAHLRELVAQTVAADLGTEPVRDADGDIVLDVGSTRVFVRVLEEAPLISVFGRLVHDVSHPFEAPAVVAKLNADYSFVKFIFGADSVIACVHLPALPFVPAQLRRMIATFSELADALDDDLVRRLGGWREIEPEGAGQEDVDDAVPAGWDAGDDELGGLPPELLTLLRLDPHGVGLEADVTARVCGYDRALTNQLLHIAGGQEAAWRQAAERDGRTSDEEGTAAGEAAGWTATRRSLARALELISPTDG